MEIREKGQAGQKFNRFLGNAGGKVPKTAGLKKNRAKNKLAIYSFFKYDSNRIGEVSMVYAM
ncbi:hypothetical protein [Pseudoflavonifractor sp. 524-17]|uniref:hypothetical protein n=1 Tax=Pseudoflavonifractor sp. 524-17 TaxID=2304577 RepID=UPI00137ABBE0|nr:hypothetical protein [Pseudoflavonifractor sp. 524-17]